MVAIYHPRSREIQLVPVHDVEGKYHPFQEDHQQALAAWILRRLGGEYEDIEHRGQVDETQGEIEPVSGVQFNDLRRE